MNLLPNTKITKVLNGAAAATSNLDSASVDMSGMDGVVFVLGVGAQVASAVCTLQIQGSNDNNSFTSLTGAAAAALQSANGQNSVVVVEVARPRHRYLRAHVNRSEANSVVDGVTCIQTLPSAAPVDDHTSVSNSVFVHAPAAQA